MLKRIILLTALLSACCWSRLQAEDTNAPAATTAAATNAAPADTTPKPDPAGTATGAATDAADAGGNTFVVTEPRSEEHTSELQSHSDLVCRLLLEKKKYNNCNYSC